MFGLDLPALPVLFTLVSNLVCPLAPQPQIAVEVVRPPMQRDDSRSTAQLQTFPVQSPGHVFRSHHNEIGGLTVGDITVKTTATFNTVTYPQHQVACLNLDTVYVEVRQELVVFVANAYPPGTCEYHAIDEHEMKHVAVDLQVVDRYLPSIRAVVEGEARRWKTVGPVPVEVSHGNMDYVNTLIETALQPVLERMFAERQYLQLQIDSPQEYERVRRQCEG